MEKGVSSQLVEDAASGLLVCKLNPDHKFKVDGSGFIKSAD
jgi:hypothetical protein